MSSLAGAAAAHASRDQESSQAFPHGGTTPSESVARERALDDERPQSSVAQPSISTLRHRRPQPPPEQPSATTHFPTSDVTTASASIAAGQTDNTSVSAPNANAATHRQTADHPPQQTFLNVAATTINTIRERAMTGAVGLGLVTVSVVATYLFFDNDVFLPFTIAACVATISSVLLRYLLSSLQVVVHRPRVRHLRRHRHFTGERAEYVRASQRLAMIDRDFTDADYELLLDLDNHSQRLRRFLDGASEETVARLPTCIYKKPESSQYSDICSKSGANSNEDVQVQTDSHDDDIVGATSRRCLICLENFEDGMVLRTLPCFHRFMAECIDTWLTQQAKCPVCKRSIQEDINALPPGVKFSECGVAQE